MKIGMIFECGPSGADKQVCEEIIRKWCPEVTLAPSITLTNKARLTSGCGEAAAHLLGEGCERVLILWDLYPAWRERGQKPCRRHDREAITKSLEAADVSWRRVALVCIEEELEAWLLADGRAVSAVLSTDAHPVHVPDVKRPQAIRNPKKRLDKIFKQHRGQPYNDLQHAIKIIKAIPDQGRLRRIPAFARFMHRLAR